MVVKLQIIGIELFSGLTFFLVTGNTAICSLKSYIQVSRTFVKLFNSDRILEEICMNILNIVNLFLLIFQHFDQFLS